MCGPTIWHPCLATTRALRHNGSGWMNNGMIRSCINCLTKRSSRLLTSFKQPNARSTLSLRVEEVEVKGVEGMSEPLTQAEATQLWARVTKQVESSGHFSGICSRTPDKHVVTILNR